MKVLSLKQPYAELILQGKKKIELRKWNTHFRGEFLIHSSLTPDKIAMRKFGFNELPLGFVVGKANIVDVKKYDNDIDFFKDKNLHLANKSFGGFGFLLEDVGRTELIPVKGQLNFWNFQGNFE